VQGEDGRLKGFGFANFADPKDAVEAVNSLDKKIIDDATLYAAPAQKKNFRTRILRDKCTFSFVRVVSKGCPQI